MRVHTFEDVQRRHPELSDDAVHRVVEMLNKRALPLRERMASESQVAPGPAAVIGDDGLTDTMRNLNAWAEENALPQPFAVGRPKP